MTLYSDVANNTIINQQIVVKEEPLEEEIEHYNYNNAVSENALKYEIEEAEHNDSYELLIKRELEQERACVKDECLPSSDTTQILLPDICNIIKTEEIHVKDEFDDPLLCLICYGTCNDKSQLLTHIADHGKRFLCNICLKTYPRNWKYTTQGHRCIPPEFRPFKCDICHKRYTEKGNLDRHKQTHKERQFSCDTCSKQFYSVNSLNNHQNYHKTEHKRKFLCDMCHKQYKQLSHLERHKLTHTGEKPFQCEICRKRFGDNTNLTNHRRSHTTDRPYECRICHTRFKTSSNLINHARIHTDERPYPCTICEKTFRKKSNLTSHFKVHRINEEIDDHDLDTKNPRRRLRK